MKIETLITKVALKLMESDDVQLCVEDGDGLTHGIDDVEVVYANRELRIVIIPTGASL